MRGWGGGYWREGGSGLLPWASRSLRTFWTEALAALCHWAGSGAEWPQVPISQSLHFGRGHWSGFESGSPGVGECHGPSGTTQTCPSDLPRAQNPGAALPVLGGCAKAGGSWGGPQCAAEKAPEVFGVLVRVRGAGGGGQGGPVRQIGQRFGSANGWI